MIKAPLGYSMDIPIYSERDKYTKNYLEISNYHIAHMRSGVENPFMSNALWDTLDKSSIELIDKHFIGGMRILDAGVCLGRILEKYSTAKRYGMDISLNYLEICKQKGIDVIYSKIEDMPYDNSFFDIVIATDVLEHVFDLYKCCEQIVRVLKLNGILVVRTPYKENLSPYLNKKCPFDFVHVRSFDENSLRLLFEKIFNLEYIETKFVFFKEVNNNTTEINMIFKKIDS